MVNYETKEGFGFGIITKLKQKTFGNLDDEDWSGHERFSSDEEMYATYTKYSGQPVTAETEVKIIHFDFTPKV